MSGYIELRVHGVSGTSTEVLLGVPKEQVTEPPVAGDAYVSFVRRVRPERDGGGVDDRLEGMSWGRLTSGAVTQALWLLLLPFALVNMAYWARPWDAEVPKGDPHGSDAGTATAYRWLVRALGLSLTVMVVFTAASASMDLIGWQCGIWQRKDCVEVNEWMSFVQNWSPGVVLAASALVPALLLVVLAFLSHRATLRYESFHGMGADGDGSDDPHLFSRRMWRGEVLVSRLRALHVATGLAVVASVSGEAARGLGDGFADVLAIAALVLSAAVVAAALFLASPSVWARWSDTGADPRPWVGAAIRMAAFVALILAVIALFIAGDGHVDQRHLPGIIGLGQGVVLGQIVLLVALFFTMVLARRRLGPNFGRPTPQPVHSADSSSGSTAEAGTAGTGTAEDGTADRLDRTEDPPRLALWGFAGWFIAALAILFGLAYSSAVMFRVSQLFTGEVAKGVCESCVTFATTIEPAPAYEIAAFGAGVFLVVLVVLLIVVMLGIRRGGKRALAWVKAEYADELGEPGAEISDSDYRVTRAVGPRAMASAVSLDRFAAILVAACAVGIGGGVYSGLDAVTGLATSPDADPDPLRLLFGDGLAPTWVRTIFDLLRDVGAWAAAGLAFGLLALGALAWRNANARRTVGIIWDIVSFWPRAGHPLAPPCYSERAIPQLACRLAYLVAPEDGPTQKVVLAGHSQGSVMAVAAIAQMRGGGRSKVGGHPAGSGKTAVSGEIQGAGQETDQAARTAQASGHEVDQVALLTFGAPLMRLYAPIFPRLFWPTRLADLPVAEGERWTNLWRRTDPIGMTMQPLLHPAVNVEETPVRGDLRLKDPWHLGMSARISAYPKVYGHSDYDVDRAYQQALERLLEATPD